MLKAIIVTPELVTIFRTYVIEGALPEHCWIWTGGLQTSGYGELRYKNRIYAAPRVAFAIYNGALSEHLEILHSCDNRICVNPTHLSQGTRQDNVDDCVSKGRQATGERNGLSKLKVADVLAIRFKAALGMKSGAIAKDHKVTRQAIDSILNGRTWKNVL